MKTWVPHTISSVLSQKAMELLDERWTMLVIRELLAGSRHFNDLRRGVPKMSPTFLSKRLHDLVSGRSTALAS